VQVGGGRYRITYSMTGAQLRSHVFDEGAESDVDATLEELQAAILRTPKEFV
jgi:hypothetical protein